MNYVWILCKKRETLYGYYGDCLTTNTAAMGMAAFIKTERRK